MDVRRDSQRPTHDDLVEGLYAAATDPARWPRALDAIGDALGGAILVTSVQHRDRVAFTATHRLDPDRDEILRQRFARPDTNPLMPLVRRLPMEAIVARDTVIAPDWYRGSALYNEVFRPQGLEHAALCCLFRDEATLIPVGILRRSTAEFDGMEAALLRGLLPHLRRALLMTARLCELEREAALARAIGDAAQRAAMVVEGDGGLVVGNARAHALLAEADGLALRAGRLVADGRHARPLASAVHAAATRSGRCGGGLWIERADGRRLAVMVVPTRATAGSCEGPAEAALVTVVVVGAQQAWAVPPERLMDLFGLTAAEAGVAAALFDGASPEAIARERAVGIATVRSQLSAIYAKTGTASATHLVRLLGQLAEAPGDG